MSLSLIIGLGIVAFLFLYLCFKLEEDHFLLKLILMFCFFFIIILIPNAAINDNCIIDVANTTLAGSVTSYEYDTFCDDTTSETEFSFLRTNLWMFRLFVIYFSCYIFYHWVTKSKTVRMWTGKRGNNDQKN